MASPVVSRTPAWKKLGLKLKFAKEACDEVKGLEKQVNGTIYNKSEDHVAPGQKKKRKSTLEQRDKTTSKKQKHDDQPSAAKDADLKTTAEPKATKSKKSKPLATAVPEIAQDKPKRRAKKSVSFVDGTKETDGADLQLMSDSEGVTLTAEQKKAEKRRKKDQRSKASSTPSTSSDRLLEYLSTFHHARAQWKFQKNRETAVLKHALSVERIPSSHNQVLAAYLSSLKSAAAKDRVAQAAKKAAEEDRKDASEQETEYMETVRSYKTRLPTEDDDAEDDAVETVTDSAQIKRLERRKRAELVYFAVTGQTIREVVTTSSSEGAAKPKPKRKTRTAVIEEDSSSSDSDSEGDSDSSSSASSSSGVGQKKQPRNTAQPRKRSGGSSSSSSESESGTNSSGKCVC